MAVPARKISLYGLLALGLLFSGCKSGADSRASVQLAQATRAMTKSAYIGSKIFFSSEVGEREPNPNANVGKFLYQRYCSECHSSPSKAPIIEGVYNASPDNESDYYIIRYGLNEMRGFSSRLTKFQMLDILAWLQSAYKAEHGQQNTTDSE